MKTNHHRQTIRLSRYDYTQPGAYFVTICSHEKTYVFGEIIDGKIRLSSAGQIAQEEWMRLDSRFQHINLDEFIIMPNHIHGIITIPYEGTAGVKIDKNQNNSRRAPTTTVEQFGKPIPGSIPTIIRSYKASVTLQIKRLPSPVSSPLWQRNYYEHIIRDEDDLNLTRQYITDNALKWEQDQYHHA